MYPREALVKTPSEPPHVEMRIAQMLKKLKERSFRLTPQRMAILRILAGSDEHPTVDEIYKQVRTNFPTTSLATVYKTIALLKELNEVLELGFPDGSNRYDGNKPFPHPHVICLKCRKIMDPDSVSVSDLSKEMQEKTGYAITFHRLDFFGVCPDCQTQEDTKAR
jgi:Fur family transcriptional regulator, peroxide stress response regulator